MFRFIIFIILAFNFAQSSHRSRHGHHQRHHSRRNHEHDTEKVFRDTVISLTKIDRRLQQFCSQHSAQGTEALFEVGGYSLLVPLAGFHMKQIDVMRRHRVVLIRAKRRVDNDTLFFSDVRILPEMVNFLKGVWDFQADRLKIFFPYKSQDNEWCSERIDDKKSRIPFVSNKHDYRHNVGVEEDHRDNIGVGKDHRDNIGVVKDHRDNIGVGKDHRDNIGVVKDHRDNIGVGKDHRDNIGVVKDHRDNIGVEEDSHDVIGAEEFTVQFSDYM